MPKHIVKHLKIGFLIFFFILQCLEHVHTTSCMGISSGEWRLCQPKARDKEGGCRCHGIVVDHGGDSDCQTRYANVPYCYVVDELSECSDKALDPTKAQFNHWNRTIHYSENACEESIIQIAEIGNENVLSGIELRNDVTDFYKKISSNSSRECQAECKNRFFCRAWTFIKGDPGVCRLLGANACCNQFQTRIQNPEATSGYNCVKDHPGFIGCWSTEGACPKCPEVKEMPSGKWEECLKNNTLLWAPTQKCYNPLEQGPCEEDEWLALRDDLPGPSLESVCVKKRCVSNDEKADTCEEVNFLDYPECSDEEIVTFNDFAHPVCHCAPDTFPLEDPYSDLDNLDQKKCYKVGDQGPCPGDDQTLSMNEDSYGLLKCSVGSDLVPLCALCGGGRKCPGRGQVYAFGSCRNGARRSG